MSVPATPPPPLGPDREPTPLEQDLVAYAAERLEHGAVGRIEQVVRADGSSRAHVEAVRAHLALYDALLDAGVSPPPPPFSAVLAARSARIPEPIVEAAASPPAPVAPPTRRASPRRARVVALAIAATVAVALGALFWSNRGGDVPRGVLASADAGAFRVTRGAHAVAFESAVAGDIVVAARDGTLSLADGPGAPSEVRLREGARLALLGPAGVALQDGAASFRVEHRTDRRFVVTTPAVVVEDQGTTFALDVSRPAPDGPFRLLVTVEEGAVRANAVLVTAGTGLAFDGPTKTGPAWPLDAKPLLTLEAEPKAATPTVRLVLGNPTDGWISVASPGDPRSPVFVAVTGPDGAETLVRVTPDMLAGEARLAGGIAPRGRVELSVRLERTLTRPGTYRLRAVWQPAGSRERPTSPELSVTVP